MVWRGIIVQHLGLVIENKNNLIAIVQVMPKSICGENCASCNTCTIKPIKVEAINEIAAKTGQTVKIEMNTSSVLWTAFLMYIAPLIVLFVSYITALKLIGIDLLSIIISIISMIIFFLSIKIYDIKIKFKKQQNKIIEIL